MSLLVLILLGQFLKDFNSNSSIKGEKKQFCDSVVFLKIYEFLSIVSPTLGQLLFGRNVLLPYPVSSRKTLSKASLLKIYFWWEIYQQASI